MQHVVSSVHRLDPTLSDYENVYSYVVIDAQPITNHPINTAAISCDAASGKELLVSLSGDWLPGGDLPQPNNERRIHIVRCGLVRIIDVVICQMVYF